MFYAVDETGKTRPPSKAQGKCTCPICGAPVIRRSGPQVTPHFAHESGEACDEWSEPMTMWHAKWCSHVQPERREVICKTPEYPGHIHRADMLAPTGHVIEVQHSSIDVIEVAEREQFYSTAHRELVWVVDAREFWQGQVDIFVPGMGDRELVGAIRRNLNESGESGAVSFHWSHPRHAWIGARCPVYLDPGRMDDTTRVFDGALFRILDATQGDPDRWGGYVPWDKTTHSPDGDMPGGAGTFITAEKFKTRYKLRLPNKNNRDNPDAYPPPGPHVTLSQLERDDPDTETIGTKPLPAFSRLGAP